MAIYALIINQVHKNENALNTPGQNAQKDVATKPESTARYEVDKFKYFDQAVYLVTFRENNRKMIVFENGTTYEVFDSDETMSFNVAQDRSMSHNVVQWRSKPSRPFRRSNQLVAF